MATITEQLAFKIKLEDTLRPKIKALFNRIVKTFAITVATTGTPPPLRIYQAVFEALLDMHYEKASKIFTGIVSKPVKQNADDDDDLEKLLLALIAWRELRAPNQAKVIVSTTQANMTEAINIALEQARNEGKILTNRELAVSAAAILKRKLNRRISSIAITETQAPSESTKYIEAEVLSGLTPSILGGSSLVQTPSKKRWRTMGDDRVRKIHHLVNGQERSLNEPFIVNGEYLRFPGDSSLGASIDNIANCRCIAVYSVK